VFHSTTCFLCLNQHNYPDKGRNLLDFFSSNFADLSVDHATYCLVPPDHFHPPFIIDYDMPVRRYKQHFNASNKRFSAGDYAMLYNALSSYDSSALYNEISVDAAVDSLNVAVT
jgi:hypothetical protein